MILTVFWISTQRLWNNKQELVLALVIPILFFSIFALIFSRGVGTSQSPVSVAIIDDDQSLLSQSIVQSVKQQHVLKSVTGGRPTAGAWSVDQLARALISRTDTDLVVHIPAGYMAALETASPASGITPESPTVLFEKRKRPSEQKTPSIRILDEGTNPVGKQILQALLGQTVASEYGLLLAGGPSALEAKLNPTVQSASYAQQVPGDGAVRFASSTSISSESTSEANAAGGQLGQMAEGITGAAEFESANVFAYNKHQPKIAMYAAGIAIMFLLFSASGAGGSLLEEREAGTLDRLLNSRLTLTQLLIGKWCFITVVGLIQMLAMFAWGQLVFGVDLLGHLDGFFALAIPTAAAGASFAILLAAICKTRNQLNGVSVILVLSMSALGGSMIPRYIMSESMQRLGKFTFNGWALDGFKKIFWYDLPVATVTTEIAVLCAITVILGCLARMLASRWSATI